MISVEPDQYTYPMRINSTVNVTHPTKSRENKRQVNVLEGDDLSTTVSEVSHSHAFTSVRNTQWRETPRTWFISRVYLYAT